MAIDWNPKTDSDFIWNWWCIISLAGVLNIYLVYSLIMRHDKPNASSKSTAAYDNTMKWLAVPYVFMTIWRSFWPAMYNERATYWDNWMSSVFLGRLLATIGEICYAHQAGYGLLRANEELKLISGRDNWFIDNGIDFLSKLSMFLCTIAQCFCITGMFTRDHWFGGIEESMWTVANASIFPCAVFMFYEALEHQNRHIDLESTKRFLFMMIFVSLAFALYVGFEHVPILLGMSAKEHSEGVEFMKITDGFWHSITVWTATKTYESWKNDWLW